MIQSTSCSVRVFLLVCVVSQRALSADYSFINIADTATAAPVGLFDVFMYGTPSISGNKVAFYGSYGGGSQRGIFTGSGGQLTTIAKSGDQVPSGALLDFAQPTISGNTVAFGAYVNARIGHFSGSGGPISSIAIPGDPSPIGPLGFPPGASPAISGGTYAYFSGGPTQGVFSSSGGTLTTIVRSGDATPAGTLVDIVPAVAISEKNVAFIGRNQDFDRAIFAGDGDSLGLIVKSGDPAPSGVFQLLGNFSVAISGNTVAFRSSFGSTPTSTPLGEGIFVGDGGSVTPVVLSGYPAPNGSFYAFADPSISGETVAFQAFFGDVNTPGYGIFTSHAGTVRPVIAKGDSLFGSVVENVDIGRYGLDPGGSECMAFWYLLSNGQTGIALAVPVPEPSAICMLVASAFSIWPSRRAASL